MSTRVYDCSKSKFLPLNMEGLTPEMVKKAEKELNEMEKTKLEGLKELKQFINAEKDFYPLMDENFLLRFLRCRKFNSEVAFKTFKNYYTFKLRYSGILTDMLPSEKELVFDLNLINVLPHRDQDGSLVGVGRLGDIDIEKVSVEDLLSALIICIEHCLQSEATQICGIVVVVDMAGLTLRLARHFASPTMAYRFVKAIQDCFPVRIKAIHIIHEPFYFNIVFNIVKKILSSKIGSRFQLHGNNLSNLHKQVPVEILPQEFGGELGPSNARDFANQLIATENRFAKLFTYGYQDERAQYIIRRSSMAPGLFV